MSGTETVRLLLAAIRERMAKPCSCEWSVVNAILRIVRIDHGCPHHGDDDGDWDTEHSASDAC